MDFSKNPTQRRKCHYLVLFNHPVDKQPIATLARQMYPVNFKEVLRYVSGKNYIQYPNSYLDYLRVRQDELIKSGETINVGE